MFDAFPEIRGLDGAAREIVLITGQDNLMEMKLSRAPLFSFLPASRPAPRTLIRAPPRIIVILLITAKDCSAVTRGEERRGENEDSLLSNPSRAVTFRCLLG